ncbi:DinB family protein [Microlunatus speluncae]|uniref:DinB family protein n=1 Tax=Microlunatus speluncae TaxID=2594267 RepID=UPI0012664D15|nr:DinB family protein [Microlunatus speluncae]
MITERLRPPPTADERTTLTAWLDFYRATIALKCDGLTEEQARTASAAPSPLTLLGLVQHLAEVERNWLRRVLAGEDAPPIFDPEADPDGPDGGFDLSPETTLADALAIWRGEVEHGDRNAAALALDHTSPFLGGEVSLRWIYTHLIAEYARHCGHADLIRERIDGRAGV